MGAALVVALIVVPLAEIWTIVQVSHVIGGWPTLALLLVESLLGAWLVRREGRRAWHAFRDALAQHRAPAREVSDAALVLLGGALLLTPGFLTDIVGFLLLIGPTRAIARRVLTRVVARRLTAATIASVVGTGRAATRPRGAGDRVVDGEVVAPGPLQPESGGRRFGARRR